METQKQELVPPPPHTYACFNMLIMNMPGFWYVFLRIKTLGEWSPTRMKKEITMELLKWIKENLLDWSPPIDYHSHRPPAHHPGWKNTQRTTQSAI